MASPDELEILGITTVAGNVPLALTQRNARMMCDLAGQQQTLVFGGCDKPMVREPVTAEYIHGNTGIDGVDVFEPETPLQDQHAVNFIIDTLLAADDASITLVPTGPLTNIGTAMRREPRITQAVKELVIMGGAMREGGNRSPSAELISWLTHTQRNSCSTVDARSLRWVSTSRTRCCPRVSALHVFVRWTIRLPMRRPAC